MTTENDSKVTANINSELYDAVSGHFHYGQRAVFFNKLFKSLKYLLIMIDGMKLLIICIMMLI